MVVVGVEVGVVVVVEVGVGVGVEVLLLLGVWKPVDILGNDQEYPNSPLESILGEQLLLLGIERRSHLEILVMKLKSAGNPIQVSSNTRRCSRSGSRPLTYHTFPCNRLWSRSSGELRSRSGSITGTRTTTHSTKGISDE